MGFKSNKVEIKGVPTDKVGTPLTHNIELTEKEIELIANASALFIQTTKKI